MARGKVGDVVFYRMNGWQMSRVRNRNPKNPRSNEQLYQRAVIATTMKAYSAGKEIFDHAFQGYTVGEGCMRRFNSLNARILREELSTDIQQNRTADNAVGRFVAPKSLSATPIIGMQVSEGTLVNSLFVTDENAGVYTFKTASNFSSIQAGDIYTFVFMVANLDQITYSNPWGGPNDANQYYTSFGWVRLIVKDNREPTGESGGWLYKDMFEIQQGGMRVTFNGNASFQSNSEVPLTFNQENYGGVMACIRSRNDVDLRSTEYMVPIHSKAFGISSPFVLEVWINEIQKIGESELILEGGDNGGNATGRMSSRMTDGYTADEVNETDDITNSPIPEEDLRPRGRRKA